MNCLGSISEESSVEELLRQVTKLVRSSGRQMMTNAQDWQHPSRHLHAWRGPGLFCSLSVRCLPRSYPPPQQYLLIKLWPIVGNPAAERLSCDPDVESQVAIRVGIGKRDDSERFPLEIKTLGFSSHKWERETKRSQQWNFPAESVDALEGLLARETRKEYTPRVAGLQVLHEFWQENLSAYHAIFREAIIWRTIYIHPGKQDDAQVFFWLILICCQVGIVPLAEEALEGHALQYLQSQWRCSESTAWEVWSRLLRHMVGNKDWTGQPKYIRRVVQDVRTREVKDRRLIFDNDPESRARQKTPNIDRERKGHLYSVYTVVEILTDGADGAWVPSYDTVYDWGNKGLFSWRQDQRKRKCLDEDGLNTVR